MGVLHCAPEAAEAALGSRGLYAEASYQSGLIFTPQVRQ